MEISISLPVAAENIAMASICAKLGKKGRTYLDFRITEEWIDFVYALPDFYNEEKGFPKEDTLKEKQNPIVASTCFTCGKVGHTVPDCRQNRQAQEKTELIQYYRKLSKLRTSRVAINCFTYVKAGHKPSAYADATKKSPTSNYTESKSVKRAMTLNTSFKTCWRQVNGKLMSLTIDTGGMISIIPTKYVSSTIKLCRKIYVTDVNGGTKLRKKVCVELGIG